LEHNRYEEYAPWMRDFFHFDQYGGKKVLEVGYGQGTDLCQFAKGGAECYGVDITDRHFELASRNFQLRNLHAELFIEDASKLHFADNTFDVVYSFGVLHHTPDTVRCISEVYRVLKPGGEFLLSLYHRHSAFHLFFVLMANGIAHRQLNKLGYQGLLATVETGADGENVKPLVKLYTPRELRVILSDFQDVSIAVKHLQREHFSKLRYLLPGFLMRSLEPRLGWYVIAKARK
jgi:SAM-dependent methyltransferase